MCIITNCDHTHLHKSMKNDARISVTCIGLWLCDYALGVDTHIAQFADKSGNMQDTIQLM